MSNVLYRVHRPQNFLEVVGQEHVVRTLLNQLQKGKLAHAYLFTGPRGVGKTSVARLLARGANCLNPVNGEPDNACQICVEMKDGKSLDLSEIDAASNTGVDNIRELIEHLPIPPTRGKYRVFIIDEVHMLSRGAFNALLKTLEEPPAHALFILATTEIHKVPATVVSRTQRFDFKKLTRGELQEHLAKVSKKEKLKVPDEVIASIAASVDGGARDALVLLEKARHLATTVEANEIEKLLGITPLKFREDLLQFLKEGRVEEIVKLFKMLSDDGYNFEQFSRDFLEYVHESLAKNPEPQLSEIASNFLEAHSKLRLSPVAELPLLVAAIKTINKKEEAKVSPTSGNGHAPEAPVKTAPAARNGEHHLEMADVQARWTDVLGRVRQYNQSLLTALKLAEPVGSVNGSITIAFPYKFHAETVSAAKNRLVVERVLEEVFGKKIGVKCVAQREMSGVTENQEGPKGNVDLLKSALEVLGGEVVE